MKQDIHPNYHEVKVTCNCGETFISGTTDNVTEMHVDICSKCHPFYTGKQKMVDTGGRIEKFNRRFNVKA